VSSKDENRAANSGEAEAAPQLIIRYAGRGAADFTIKMEGGITLGQLLAAAGFLDLIAQEMRAAQFAQQVSAVDLGRVTGDLSRVLADLKGKIPS
jgi:hypothetical protein